MKTLLTPCICYPILASPLTTALSLLMEMLTAGLLLLFFGLPLLVAGTSFGGITDFLTNLSSVGASASADLLLDGLVSSIVEFFSSLGSAFSTVVASFEPLEVFFCLPFSRAFCEIVPSLTR